MLFRGLTFGDFYIINKYHTSPYQYELPEMEMRPIIRKRQIYGKI